MEASTETPPITPPPSPNGAEPEHSPAETANANQMFRYSDYVHVGPGAAECEDAEDGKCGNPLHFHVWIRLPNQFQHSSIREKALAAKARKLRQLRDPESDARAIVESDLDEFIDSAASDDDIIDALANKDFFQVHLRAMREVQDEDEFKTIDEDRERLKALQAKPEEERDAEEFKELEAHNSAYMDRVEEVRNGLQRPLRESLQGKPREELRELLLKERIAKEGQDEFNRTYSIWEWYIATLKPVPEGQLPSERYFAHIDHLRAAAPEVIEALEEAFNGIEAEAGRQLRGF